MVISFSLYSTFVFLYEFYLLWAVPLAVPCKTQADGSLQVHFRCSRAFEIASQAIWGWDHNQVPLGVPKRAEVNATEYEGYCRNLLTQFSLWDAQAHPLVCLLVASKRSGPLPWAFWKFDFACSSQLRSLLRFYGSVVLFVLLVLPPILHTNNEQGKDEFCQLFRQVKLLLRLNRCQTKHPLIQADTESTYASLRSSSSNLRYILRRHQSLRTLHSLHH